MNGKYRGRGFGQGRFQSWKSGRGGGGLSGKWRGREHRPDLNKATGKHPGKRGQQFKFFFSSMKESVHACCEKQFNSNLSVFYLMLPLKVTFGN